MYNINNIYENKTPRQKRADYEKRELRKSSDRTGIILVSILGVSLFLGFIVGIVLAIIKNSQSDSAYGFTYQIASGVVYIVSFIVAIIMGLSDKKLDKRALFKKPSTTSQMSLYLLLFGAFACVVANVHVNSIEILFSEMGINLAGSSDVYVNNLAFFLLYTITIAVLPAIIEEFIFRGIILTPLRKYGDLFAILVSSCVFAFVHLNVAQIPFALIVGIVLGFIRIKTDSLIIPICVHFINNFVSCILTAVGNAESIMITSLSFLLYIALFSILGMLVVYYFVKDKRDIFAISRGKTVLSFKQSLKAFVGSPILIVSIAISFVIILINLVSTQ